jgi:hypothetical protein
MTVMGPTIYEVLRRKLGREPTHAELKADVQRILEEARADRGRRLTATKAHVNGRNGAAVYSPKESSMPKRKSTAAPKQTRKETKMPKAATNALPDLIALIEELDASEEDPARL